MVRFRASRNPNPSKRTHNVLVEIVWTLVPCLILIVMAVPSFKVLYSQDAIPKADVTIKDNWISMVLGDTSTQMKI